MYVVCIVSTGIQGLGGAVASLVNVNDELAGQARHWIDTTRVGNAGLYIQIICGPSEPSRGGGSITAMSSINNAPAHFSLKCVGDGTWFAYHLPAHCC